MIIPQDRRGYERVAILNEQAVEAHRPTRGLLRRAAVADYALPANLAAEAEVTVDSFGGTTNVGREADLYPILNQVDVGWSPGAVPGIAHLALGTATPCWDAFEWRADSGPWKRTRDNLLAWHLHSGRNEVSVRCVNSAGKIGQATHLVLQYAADGALPWPECLVVQSLPAGRAAPEVIPFGWEDFVHPRLCELRQRYRLDDVIAGAPSDLERVVRLRDWVKSRWDHEQPIAMPPWDALFMLERAEKNIEYYFCVHYSVAFMQCCLSLGIPARLINLHQGIPPAGFDRQRAVFQGSDQPVFEHVVNEVWLDDLGQWALMDVDFDIHYQRDGQLLTALDIHRAFLSGELDRLEVSEGPLAYKLKASATHYQLELPRLYAHFSAFWRNNHLSDPDGPTQILHWVDERTPPMLWWEGSDLRHRPEMIGPAIVAWPYAPSTPRLTDGNVATCWASSEEPVAHWVELRWSRPVCFSQVVVDWPECWKRYWTSAHYRLQALQDGQWTDLLEVVGDRETALDRHAFPAVHTQGLRLWQPVGGGADERPHQLWLAEIEVYE